MTGGVLILPTESRQTHVPVRVQQKSTLLEGAWALLVAQDASVAIGIVIIRMGLRDGVKGLQLPAALVDKNEGAKYIVQGVLYLAV